MTDIRYSIKDKVKLFKPVVGRTGNYYPPGIYSIANPLPQRFLTPEYVHLIEKHEDGEDSETLQAVKLNDTPGGINEVEIKPNKPAIEVTDIKAVSTKESKQAEVNVNEADYSSLVALNGIGKNIAKKVIELRELFPFSSHEDLNDRVPLAFGRNWNDYPLKFGDKK